MDGSAPPVRVLVLGPPLIATPSATIQVAGPLQIALLSLLTVQPGRVLRAEELVDRLWPNGAPPSAATALRVHVTRLRSTLGSSGLLAYTGGGYSLDPQLVHTDAADFERVATELTRGIADDRLERCDEALALWRGRPFDGAEDEELTTAAERLEQHRLAVEDARCQALLDLGRHVQVTPDLIALVRAEPLREQRTVQLMLAHYRSGRQADALDAYRVLRDRLADELGVDPGEGVRRLELRILRQDPDLGGAAPAASSRPDPRPPRTVRGLAMPPEALAGIALERLGTLPDQARTLVQLIAVLGDPIAADRLSSSLSLPTSVLDQLVRQVEAAGLLVFSEAAQLGFRRSELGDALVWALDPALRARLHATAGQVLAGPEADTADLVRAAWHLIASGSVGARGRWSVLHRALEAAARAGADDVVEQLAGAALSASPDEVQTIDLRVALAQSLAAQGRPAEANELWHVALNDARATGDATRFALVVLAATWRLRSVGGSAELGALLSEALHALGSGLSAVRVSVQGGLLLEEMQLGRVALLHADLDGLQADAAAVGDPESLATALHARHVLLRGTAELDVRRRWADELGAAATKSGDPWWRALAMLARIFDCYAAFEFDHVQRLCVDLLAEAQASMSQRDLWHHHLTMASLNRDRGDIAEADRWAEEAVLLGATHGIADAQAALTLHRLLVAFHVGGVAPFVPAIDVFLAAHPDALVARGLSALALSQAGEADRVASVISATLAQLDASATDEAVGLTLGLLAQATTNPEQAAEVHQRLLPYSGQFLVFGQVSGTFGPADRCLAVAASTMGDNAGAAHWLARAEDQCLAGRAAAWASACAVLRGAMGPT